MPVPQRNSRPRTSQSRSSRSAARSSSLPRPRTSQTSNISTAGDVIATTSATNTNTNSAKKEEGSSDKQTSLATTTPLVAAATTAATSTTATNETTFRQSTNNVEAYEDDSSIDDNPKFNQKRIVQGLTPPVRSIIATNSNSHNENKEAETIPATTTSAANTVRNMSRSLRSCFPRSHRLLSVSSQRGGFIPVTTSGVIMGMPTATTISGHTHATLSSSPGGEDEGPLFYELVDPFWSTQERMNERRRKRPRAVFTPRSRRKGSTGYNQPTTDQNKLWRKNSTANNAATAVDETNPGATAGTKSAITTGYSKASAVVLARARGTASKGNFFTGDNLSDDDDNTITTNNTDGSNRYQNVGSDDMNNEEEEEEADTENEGDVHHRISEMESYETESTEEDDDDDEGVNDIVDLVKRRSQRRNQTSTRGKQSKRSNSNPAVRKISRNRHVISTREQENMAAENDNYDDADERKPPAISKLTARSVLIATKSRKSVERQMIADAAAGPVLGKNASKPASTPRSNAATKDISSGAAAATTNLLGTTTTTTAPVKSAMKSRAPLKIIRSKVSLGSDLTGNEIDARDVPLVFSLNVATNKIAAELKISSESQAITASTRMGKEKINRKKNSLKDNALKSTATRDTITSASSQATEYLTSINKTSGDTCNTKGGKGKSSTSQLHWAQGDTTRIGSEDEEASVREKSKGITHQKPCLTGGSHRLPSNNSEKAYQSNEYGSNERLYSDKYQPRRKKRRVKESAHSSYLTSGRTGKRSVEDDGKETGLVYESANDEESCGELSPANTNGRIDPGGEPREFVVIQNGSNNGRDQYDLMLTEDAFGLHSKTISSSNAGARAEKVTKKADRKRGIKAKPSPARRDDSENRTDQGGSSGVQDDIAPVMRALLRQQIKRELDQARKVFGELARICAREYSE